MPNRRKKDTYHRKLVITNPRRLSTFFIIIGVVLIAVPQIFKHPVIKQKSDEVVQEQQSTQNLEVGPIKIDNKLLSNEFPSQPPLRIVIPKYNIDLSVVEAPVVNGLWETSETTASHGIGSANPGQIGNAVVFAHARAGLFLPLRDIKKDEVIYILTKDRWFRYRVSETKLVEPTQVEVISQTLDERLTLFTCSGFLDSKRLIVTALPLSP